MYVLGISAFYHDSAAALIRDGEIIAAAQEERFTRKKQDADFPVNAIGYCLKTADITLEQVDFVTFYDKPFLKFERLLETYIDFSPKGFRSFSKAMPLWIKEKLFQKKNIIKALQSITNQFNPETLHFTEHHISHAASAFFPSNFKQAVILTLDGVGEWTTTSAGIGCDNMISIEKEIHFPHSLGLLYSAFTYYAGFKVNSGEYKVMGLAPYGQPKYTQLILDHLIDLKADGTFRLNQRYFNYCVGLTMTNHAFHQLFGGKPRNPESAITQKEMDLAASVQAVTEEIMLRLTRSLAKEYQYKNLCLAGGVALNCVANGKIIKDAKFDNVWIQPAAGDAGGAIGAALYTYHAFQKQPRRINHTYDNMKNAYLGPEFSQHDIEQRLTKLGANYTVLPEETLLNETVQVITNEKSVGWFQGRMEFGPRALGNRSIIADPRSPSMQKFLNLKIKFRESFRPFAPSVLYEDQTDWFDLHPPSPYMLLVADVAKQQQHTMSDEEQALFGIDKLNVARSHVPAITHVDYSARVQSVFKDTNPLYHALISKFKEKTGCPMLVNTSFNVRGEPIVCTPEDAFKCFMGTDMDYLVIGNCLLNKQQQDSSLAQHYYKKFKLD